MNKTIAERITVFCERTNFDAIPLEVIEKVKHLTVDVLGVCVASLRFDFGQEILNFV